jgi:tripartite-type tricarboxylate transporter receptor subunit TctC
MKRWNRSGYRLTVAAAFALAAIALCTTARAQTYPNRPITAIVPFVGGSASDVVTRILLDKMSRSMGQPIIIENRPGAGGSVGAATAARAKPNGYTLLCGGSVPLPPNKWLYRELGYDPETDFEAISPFAAFTIIVVASNALPVNSLQELIAYARARPGELNYGSVGVGSSQHLAGEFFSQVTGVKITHVPYRNIAQYGPELISGAVPLGFQWYPNISFALQAKGAKALAVAGPSRLAAVPNSPTTTEAGVPEYMFSGWFALLAPKGTPADIVARLNSELAAAVADPDVRSKFALQGAVPMSLPPDQAKAFISDEIRKYHDIITKAGISPE